MIVLNLTAERESNDSLNDLDTEDDIVFRLHGEEIFRTRAIWARYEGYDIEDAVGIFTSRLQKLLMEGR